MSAIVALTAQNTVGVTAVHEVPPAFVVAQLEAVLLRHRRRRREDRDALLAAVIEAVAGVLADQPRAARRRPGDGRIVGRAAARGRRGRARSSRRLFPLATVVTPNLLEARALAGRRRPRRELAERLVALGARGGDRHRRARRRRSTISSTAREHVEIPVERHDVAATHGAGLHPLGDARRPARARPAARRGRAGRGRGGRATLSAHGLAELGAGDGPVDVLNVKGSTMNAGDVPSAAARARSRSSTRSRTTSS